MKVISNELYNPPFFKSSAGEIRIHPSRSALMSQVALYPQLTGKQARIYLVIASPPVRLRVIFTTTSSF